MDYIQRKVFLTKYLTPFDSDGDGKDDSLVLSATTKTIQIPLSLSFDDMGIYDIVDDERVEFIDIGGLFDGDIGDGATPEDGGTTSTGSNWGPNGGNTDNAGSGGVIEVCTDQTASNYAGNIDPNTGALTLPDGSVDTVYEYQSCSDCCIIIGTEGTVGGDTEGASSTTGNNGPDPVDGSRNYNYWPHTGSVCKSSIWSPTNTGGGWATNSSFSSNYSAILSYAETLCGSGRHVLTNVDPNGGTLTFDSNTLDDNGNQYFAGVQRHSSSSADGSYTCYRCGSNYVSQGTCCSGCGEDETPIYATPQTRYRFGMRFYCIDDF
jgi:hypothetical protein